MFGTYYLPATWPSGYGIHDKVPRGWLRQLVYPFLPKPRAGSEPPTVKVHE
jgi:hypothetical protein